MCTIKTAKISCWFRTAQKCPWAKKAYSVELPYLSTPFSIMKPIKKQMNKASDHKTSITIHSTTNSIAKTKTLSCSELAQACVPTKTFPCTFRRQTSDSYLLVVFFKECMSLHRNLSCLPSGFLSWLTDDYRETRKTRVSDKKKTKWETVSLSTFFTSHSSPHLRQIMAKPPTTAVKLSITIRRCGVKDTSSKSEAAAVVELARLWPIVKLSQ